MGSNDPSIIAAMDGHEGQNGTSATGSVSSREEPTPYFYVIFGIAFEALASSSSESAAAVTSGTRQSPAITALQALKYLVRPEFAGKAILEPTILDEFISLSYRLAMTESAAVQVHLLEMLAVFAVTQDKSGDNESK